MFQQADLARLREWAGCSDDVTRQRLDSEETGHEDDGDHSNDDDDEDHDDYFHVDEEKILLVAFSSCSAVFGCIKGPDQASRGQLTPKTAQGVALN